MKQRRAVVFELGLVEGLEIGMGFDWRKRGEGMSFKGFSGKSLDPRSIHI